MIFPLQAAHSRIRVKLARSRFYAKVRRAGASQSWLVRRPS